MRQDKSLTIRVTDQFLKGLDELRRRERDVPTRAEMLRRMVEMFLQPASDLWQPKETAPKDGREIFVCNEFGYDVVSWQSDFKQWHNGDVLLDDEYFEWWMSPPPSKVEHGDAKRKAVAASS